jgi:co-chaperonin GroES (HSP10)
VFSLKEVRGILMKKAFGVFALILFALTAGINAQAQGSDPAITATRVFGKITEINAPAGEVTVKTDAGSVVSVKLSEKTTYERMPVGETDRTKAVKIALTDITVGDGVYARGYVSEDRKSVPAQQVIVVSQSDIAKKQEKERLEWRQRGISGIIESLNPQTKEITVTTRAAEGPKPVIIPVTDKVKIRRYAPDSIKFSEAKKSSWDELKVGDQLRAKGDKSADGARFTAEEVVTGSFRTIGGAITAVDTATNEIKLNDIQSKQPLTVVVRKDSTLKRIPPEFMQMMAAGGAGGPGAGGGPPAGGAATPQGGSRPPAGGAPAGGAGGPQGKPGGPGGGAPGGGFDIQRMIDNLPATTLAELKPGEMVLLLSTSGADPTRATAITLVSGVEPIFAMLQARQGGPANRPPNLGTINLGIGGP